MLRRVHGISIGERYASRPPRQPGLEPRTSHGDRSRRTGGSAPSTLPISDQLRAFLRKKEREGARWSWERASDSLLREVLTVVSHDRGQKPIWWFSSNDFYDFPLPSLERKVGGLARYIINQGENNFEAGRRAILGTRLGIPKPTLEEEVAYFQSVSSERQFHHWQEVSDDFLILMFAVASLHHKKSLRRLSVADFRTPFPALGGKKLGGMVDFCRDPERRDFEAGKRKLLERLLQGERYQINLRGVAAALAASTFPPPAETLLIVDSAGRR